MRAVWVTGAAAVVAALLVTVSSCDKDTPRPLPTAPDQGVTADGASGTALDLTPSQVFVGAGDISKCSNDRDEATAQLLLDVIAATPSATVFTLGDNAYPDGSAADYANCYGPTWGRPEIKSRTYAALGNHDYDLGSATPAFDYFGSRVGPRGKGYYSFDLGSWHIIVLNDNKSFVPFSSGSAQDQWLQADLAATAKQCVLAIWHQPRFFSSTGSWTSSSARKILWDRLYAAGAELVLNGHKHHYERFAPQTPDGVRDDARGIREIIVGTGGESTAYPTNERANSEVRAGTFGVLKLTLNDGSYTWEFIPIPGRTFRDSGTGTCH